MKLLKQIIYSLLILLIISNVYSTKQNSLDNSLSILLNISEIASVQLEIHQNENLLDTSKNVSLISNIQSNSYNLSGMNINLLQYELGVPGDHDDFGDRLNTENLFSTISDHATHVAGILIGNGSFNSNYTGVAYQANLYTYQLDVLPFGENYDLENNFEDGINNLEVDIISNSWGSIACSVLGEYNSMTQIIDEIINVGSDNKYVPIVWAAGNQKNCNISSGFFTIVPQATAKNTISVGNINDNRVISETSSYGPTDDGRIKPDLVAPGINIYSTISDDFIDLYNNSNYSQKVSDGIDDFDYPYESFSGTSMAAPHVSGTIALMLEQWNKSGYQTTLGDPLPSTIKALLLDSTVDLSRTGNGTQMIDGPDYVNGFGLLDAKGAVDRIINGTFIESNISEEYDLDVYAINITYQDTLKVTLAWDDIPNHNLVNDLDLYLLSPSGTKYYPWTLDPINPSDPAIQTEADHDNVVEQVYISEDEIEEGQWLIVVSSTECATINCPQKYSLVSEYSISQYVPLSEDTDLYAYYTFNADTKDSTAYYNDATNYDATLTSSGCHDGSCYLFDGVNDYIDLNTNFDNTASEITFSGWFNLAETPSINAPYFDCVYDGNHEFSRLEYIPNQNGLRANWRTSDGNSQLASSYLTQDVNTWHHLVFVKNITSNKFNIYLDGEIEYSVTDNGNGDFNYNNRNCLLGKYHGSTGYWFEGKIDDLSLWDRAFSTEEIQRLYNYGISYE